VHLADAPSIPPIGRRGKPVKKLHLIPAEDAHAMARYFQGRKGTTVSVIRATSGGSASHRLLSRSVFSVLTQGLAECDLRNLAHSRCPWHGERPRDSSPMSWSEPEHFVGDVEADAALQRALEHCRPRTRRG
jgi:hypothetical protein